MILCHEDITEQKLTEEALQRAEKLAATGRLAATIAHEINNPLEAITNLLYLLETNPSLNRGARKYLAMAQQELGRVSHIAKQTLGFYRQNAAWEPVDMPQLLDEVLTLYRPKLLPKRIVVEKACDANCVVDGLRGELRQLFANLIANAVDAMDDDGRLQLAVREENGAITVNIRDTGKGIASEHLTKIFDPFFTTKKHLGTGLGLWVARGIVEKHRGSITLESSTSGPQRGTAIRIHLPKSLSIKRAAA